MPAPASRPRTGHVSPVGVAVFVALLAIGTVALVVAKTWDRSLTADELVAYQNAVHPPLSDGGRTIEQGMRPAVTDLATPGGVPPAAIADEAQAWARDLEAVRARVAAVTPPRELRRAHDRFLGALVRYVEAARTFGRAAAASEAERGPILDQGIATAKSADEEYDEGSRVLQDWRRKLGLGPTADFPDPAAR